MLKILCPTDFSQNSEFAIEYAINLSNALHAKLYFVTSFKVPRVAGSLRSLDEKISDALKEDLNYFVEKFESLIKTGVSPDLSVVEGNTTVSILDYARKQNIDMIIMGTKGSSSISNIVMGSITKKFFENSTIPVLAIPESVKYQMTGNRILLSLDEKGISNLHSIELLKALGGLDGSQIDIFHVSKPDEKIELNINTGLLGEISKNIIDIDGIDPVYEIKKYVDENEIGIIAMVGRKHTFWERLFLETNTTAELFSTNVPILLLPE